MTPYWRQEAASYPTCRSDLLTRPARLASCNPHMTSTPDAGAPLSPQAARDSPPGSPAISPIQPPVRGAYKEPSPARDASDPNPDPSPPGSPAISPIKLPVQAVRNKPRLEYSGNDKPNESVPGSPAISPIPARKQPSPLRHGVSSHATVPKLGEKRPCPDDEAIDNQAPKNKKAARVDRKRLRLEEKAMPAPKPKVKAPARIGRRSPDENDNDKDHAGSDNCHKPQAPAQLNTSASALGMGGNACVLVLLTADERGHGMQTHRPIRAARNASSLPTSSAWRSSSRPRRPAMYGDFPGTPSQPKLWF